MAKNYRRFHHDLETYCDESVKVIAADAYSRHELAEILMCAYAFDDEPVKQWDASKDPQLPAEIEDALLDDRVFKFAWNKPFEWSMWANTAGIVTPHDRWRDPMVLALSLCLPGALDKCGQVVELDAEHLKSSEGRALIKRFSAPRKKSKHDARTRIYAQDDPEKWERYLDYNRQDVIAERSIWKKLVPYNMPRSEWELWVIDQEINQAGIPINSRYVENAMEVFADFKRTRLARMADLTGLANPNSNQQILPWLQENGYVFDDLRAPHIARGLERAQEEGRDDLAAVLALRQQVSKTSPTKYAALDRLMDREGGVIRNAFQFAGAGRTWRWAGRGYQAQNLPRPAKSLEKGIAIHAANLGRLSLEEIELFYDDPMDLLKAGIRPAAQAPEGYTFIDADLNAIENRVLGWIANDVKILDVFRHGKDPYIDFACDLYEQPYDKLMAEYKAGNGAKRTIAKPGVLGCFGADTPVLTPRGWVRIVDLRHDDKVHDGETWVPHEGVAYMGQKDVLSLSQVYVTPDHEIEIEEAWETCQQVIQQNAMPLALASANGKLWSSSAHHAARARSTDAGASAAWNVKLGEAILRSARHHSAIAARKKPVGAISEFELVPICSTPSRVVSTLREIGVRTPTSEVIVTTAGGEYVVGSTTRKSGFPIFATNSTRGLFSRLIRRWRSTGSTTTGTTNREISNSPLGSKTSETRATVYDVVNAGPRHRFVIMTADGPIIVSNCGYMLGPGKKVVNKDTGEPEGTGLLGYAWNMGVTEFTPEQAELSVKKWREKYQTVVSFWYDFENAFRRCISSREPQEFACFRFDWSGPFVRMRLPSGRFLHYCRPRIENLMMPWGKMKMSITYEQQNDKSQWARVSTHPGKVTENADQAIARDLLAHGMRLAKREAGLDIRIHVHDQLLGLSRIECAEDDLKTLQECMCVVPDWAPGMPMASAGFISPIFIKD